MKKYLEEAFSVDKLTGELNNKAPEFDFTTLDNHVIGYMKVNFGTYQTKLKDEGDLEIERIYVTQVAGYRNMVT